jgi:hypothetical protein
MLGDEVRFAHDSPVEGDGFEPSVPGEGKLTYASFTFDRYRRPSAGILDPRGPTFNEALAEQVATKMDIERAVHQLTVRTFAIVGGLNAVLFPLLRLIY